jgi:organic radical activating enzyme
MWSDINLNIPSKEIRNCCKREPTRLSIDDLKSLGADSFTKNKILVADKKFLIDNNELPTNCTYCKATWPNSIWNNWNIWQNKDWSTQELIDLPSKDYTNQIEVMLGITCNQTCMYCTDRVSSAWADIKGISIVKDNEWEETALQNLYQYIENNKVQDDKYVWYNFLGGEPLLEPRIFNVIEKIIDIHTRNFRKNKKITINLTSNLNVKPKTIERFLEIVERNSNFQWSISTSLDGIGKQGEEIRDGLNFKNFENNIHKLFSSKLLAHIDLLPSVSCLSIPYHHELISWYLDLASKYCSLEQYGDSWSIGMNVVTWPDAMHPGILPNSYKEEMDRCIEIIENYVVKGEKFPPLSIQNYKTHLLNVKNLIGTKRNNNNLENAKDWYKAQGLLKNKDYFQIFPSLEEILKY